MAVGWFDSYTVVFAAYAAVSLLSAAALVSLRELPSPLQADAP
jgi:hypothetical protein